MPVLINPRHECFANEIAKGSTALEAADAAEIELRSCKGAKGFYVYVLVDPRNAKVFYVGKGKDKRAFAHFEEWRTGIVVNGAKSQIISEIAALKMKPCAFLIEDGLDEECAFDIERLMIRKIGRKNLTNAVKGQRSETAKLLFEACDSMRHIRLPKSPEEVELYLEIVTTLMRIRDWARAKLGMPAIGGNQGKAYASS